MFPSDVDRAWAAGFFDGEGCFRAGPGVPNRDGVWRYYLRATLSQKYPVLVHRFHDIVGVGSINYSPPRPTSSQAFVWQCGSKAGVERVGDLLWPWLGEQKRGDLHRARLLVAESRAAADVLLARGPRACGADDCDNEFTPLKHDDARFCSSVCAARQLRHDNWVPPTPRPCKGCGCHSDSRTRGCRRCMTRHWERKQRRTAERG